MIVVSFVVVARGLFYVIVYSPPRTTMITLAARRALCPWCKQTTQQQLRVSGFRYIYCERWICVECISANRGAGVVEDVTCFYPDGETVKEIASRRRPAKKARRRPRQLVKKKRAPRRLARQPRRLG